MGAGSAIGLVDNPIQREVHTDWPTMAGSGIKGAIRHALKTADEWKNGELSAIFGPEAGELHAGAISFTDAQIVCFPVRSLKRAFVYATCPAALARLARLSHGAFSFQNVEVKEQETLIANDELKQDNKLILEALAYTARTENKVSEIAKWIAEQALPPGFFADKLKKDLVILSDTDFTHFVRNSTLIEPHVRIDDETGTASKGGLFYTENLLPETILVTLMMASDVRDGKTNMKANQVMQKMHNTLNNGKPWQFGGDATTGRGLVMLKIFAGGEDNARKP